jgi:hypothetical protein
VLMNCNGFLSVGRNAFYPMHYSEIWNLLGNYICMFLYGIVSGFS